MIYRASLVPDTKLTIAHWRELFMQRCGEDPIFLMSQAFGDRDPRPFGIDGAIEFPPHKVVDGLSTINAQLDLLDTEFSAQVYDYDQIVAQSLATPTPGLSSDPYREPVLGQRCKAPGGSGPGDARLDAREVPGVARGADAPGPGTSVLRECDRLHQRMERVGGRRPTSSRTCIMGPPTSTPPRAR